MALVIKRAGDITIEDQKRSRLHLWEGAIDYATKHPFIGAGYGNWKLAFPFHTKKSLPTIYLCLIIRTMIF
jgi:O-antigen ligase